VFLYTAFIIIIIIIFCILEMGLLWGVVLYTSQSCPYLYFKLGYNNQIQTYQYLCYIMLGSPKFELGTAIKLTL